MPVTWKREPACHGSGIWFVGVEDARVNVIAPPGVLVTRDREREGEFSYGPPGWRWAVWARFEDQWPLIDTKAPDAMREIDTREALQLLSDDLHELVWACLALQARISRGFGRVDRGLVPSEELVRAGAVSTAWLTAEMSRAFPARADLLMAPSNESDEPIWKAPDDLTELARPVVWSDDMPLPLSCGAPLRDLVSHWLSWKLGTRRRSKWLATKVLASARDAGGLPACGSQAGKEGSLRHYDWGREESGGEPELEELVPH
jgi:hypothetical protein